MCKNDLWVLNNPHTSMVHGYFGRFIIKSAWWKRVNPDYSDDPDSYCLIAVVDAPTNNCLILFDGIQPGYKRQQLIDEAERLVKSGQIYSKFDVKRTYNVRRGSY